MMGRKKNAEVINCAFKFEYEPEKKFILPSL